MGGCFTERSRRMATVHDPGFAFFEQRANSAARSRSPRRGFHPRPRFRLRLPVGSRSRGCLRRSALPYLRASAARLHTAAGSLTSSGTASTHFNAAGPPHCSLKASPQPRSLRRLVTQFANVAYLIPASRANFAPLAPLRSNSSSSASRRSADTRTRPRTSCFRTSVLAFIDVIGVHALTSMTQTASGASAVAYNAPAIYRIEQLLERRYKGASS